MVATAPSPADSGIIPPPVTAIRWPSLLPDGRHVLVGTNTGVAVFTLASGELHPLFHGGASSAVSWGSRARYLPTGHLIYDHQDGRIRVIPFDLDRLEVTGEPIPAFEAFRGPGGARRNSPFRKTERWCTSPVASTVRWCWWTATGTKPRSRCQRAAIAFHSSRRMGNG